MITDNPKEKIKDKVSLTSAIEDYFHITKNLKNYSDATIASYRTDFNQFEKFLESNGDDSTDITTITPALIEDFCLGLLEKKLSINSVHRKKDALSSLFRHCVKRGWIDRNPVEQVEIARKKKNVREVFLDRQEIIRFIEADIKIKGYNNATLRAAKIALCFTGMRNSELRKLDWENIDFHNNTIRIYDSKNSNRKGHPDNLDREVPICTCLKNALYEIRADSGPVFKNNKGKAITKDALANLVKRAAQSIELKKPLTPHALRHNLSSNLEKLGGTQSDMALLLGHAPSSTTSGYIHSSLERISKLVEDFSTSVMEEKANMHLVKYKDEFNFNEIDVPAAHEEKTCVNTGMLGRKDVVIDLCIISEAEKVWNEINGEKSMPASFLLGYVLRS